eukprot:scaffold17146_cov110-Isochrysis_galbana.AAC.9
MLAVLVRLVLVNRLRKISFTQSRPVSRAWFSPSFKRCLRPCTPPVRLFSVYSVHVQPSIRQPTYPHRRRQQAASCKAWRQEEKDGSKLQALGEWSGIWSSFRAGPVNLQNLKLLGPGQSFCLYLLTRSTPHYCRGHPSDSQEINKTTTYTAQTMLRLAQHTRQRTPQEEAGVENARGGAHSPPCIIPDSRQNSFTPARYIVV